MGGWTHRAARFGLTVVLGGTLAACSSSGNSPAGGRSPQPTSGGLTGALNVYAAASLTQAFDTIKAQFVNAHPDVHITITFGGSSDLSAQISNGAPVDVFASAATANMATVKQAIKPTNFVTNTMEIAVPPNNPAHITSVRELANPGVKVAVCAAAVPCGVVAHEVFANAKITFTPAASEPDVTSTLAAVESGEVDAGMVYVTDVRTAGSKVKGITIPANLNATTEYPIAALKSSKNLTAAKAFVRYVLSPAGKKVLTADGFSKP